MEGITQTIGRAAVEFSHHLYFREDIQKLIDELAEQVKKKHIDREHTLRSYIVNMLEAYEVKTSRYDTPKDYAAQLQKSTIPSVEQFPYICWNKMLNFNMAYVSPRVYMERLVNTLVDEDYRSPDTAVRVKILQQFLDKLNYLKGTRFYTEALKCIVDEKCNGNIREITNDVFDSMFQSKHCVSPQKRLRVILEVFGDVLYRDGETDDILEALTEQYDASVKGKTACELIQFLSENNPKVTVDANGTTDKTYPIWDYDEQLVIRIRQHIEQKLKEYKETFKADLKGIEEEKEDPIQQLENLFAFMRRHGAQESVLSTELSGVAKDALKDRIQAGLVGEVLATALMTAVREKARGFSKIRKEIATQLRGFMTQKNELLKSKTSNVRDHVPTLEILNTCQDLEKGYFRSAAKMKEALYLFAFAFDMVVDPDKAENNPRREIRKNLFEDFYSDNIVRYVDDAYGDSGGESEPTGITIQYKNFAEIVYLYWLNKDSDSMKPAEKYAAANEMIEEIVSRYKAAKKAEKKGNAGEKAKWISRKELGTEIYRGLYDGYFYDEEIQKPLKMEKNELIDFLLENYDIDVSLCSGKNWSTTVFDNESEQERASLIFSERMKGIEAFTEYYSLELYDWFVNQQKTMAAKPQEDPREKTLASLLEKVNDQIKKTFCGETVALTRTRYMYLYYNWFIQDRINREDDYTEIFEDFYTEYCEQLNQDLEECSYQLFSEKNLIDMLLLYSAFIILRTEIPLEKPADYEERLLESAEKKADEEQRKKRISPL